MKKDSLDSITLEFAEKVVEYWKNKKAKKTYELEDENLRVEPEYVDNVTVFEKDGNQYFTFDAALIHAKRLGKRIPTKEQWEVIRKEYSVEELNSLLPLNGYRNASYSAFNYQGMYGYYWTYSTTGPNGCSVNLPSTLGVDYANTNYRANGFSVRCIKD